MRLEAGQAGEWGSKRRAGLRTFCTGRRQHGTIAIRPNPVSHHVGTGQGGAERRAVEGHSACTGRSAAERWKSSRATDG